MATSGKGRGGGSEPRGEDPGEQVQRAEQYGSVPDEPRIGTGEAIDDMAAEGFSGVHGVPAIPPVPFSLSASPALYVIPSVFIRVIRVVRGLISFPSRVTLDSPARSMYGNP